MTLEGLFATALASAVGAFVAAYFGFRYAMTRLKKERAFDRRLQWYEETCKLLTDVANKLNWAAAADLAQVSKEQKSRAWSEAQQGLASLRGVEVSAEMYASDAAYQAVSEAMTDVTTVAKTAFIASQVPDVEVRGDRLFEICRKLLYHAASRLATDVRAHLDLEPVSREWRLYDQEFRELRTELAEIEEKVRPHTEAAGLEEAAE